ncbi:WD40 repeat-like protein [Zopfia rhizophila CBS 207.26]|uniref:WD40 repeat-like protein n=1 Tax=Zopfia rhizophila CBS 207.26 TaxID=1314779 RepID=A0A6A6EIW6_9PEZI|nr:WD40 repeat-like protein [Zopfia rhizophila CBS 207.26]
MTVEALSSNVVNYLVWRYLQEAGYGNAALQLSRCWVRDPESLPFAKNVGPHTLINLLQDGLWFDKLQAEAANGEQRYRFGRDHGRPYSSRNGDTLTLDQGVPAHQLAEEANGAVQEPVPRKGPGKRKRGRTNGIEPRMDPQVNGDAMDIDQNGHTHVTNSVRAESEAVASETESPTVAEIPISTLSIGQSTEIQTEKIADMFEGTTYVSIKEPGKTVTHTLWGTPEAPLLLAAGRSLLRLHHIPKGSGANSVQGPQSMDLKLLADEYTVTALCWNSHEEATVSVREESVNEGGEVMRNDKLLKVSGEEVVTISSTAGMISTMRWNGLTQTLLTISTTDISGFIRIWKGEEDLPVWTANTEKAILDAAWMNDTTFVVCGERLFQIYEITDSLKVQQTFETQATWESVKYEPSSGIIASLAMEEMTSFLGIVHPNDPTSLKTHEYPDAYFSDFAFQPRPISTSDSQSSTVVLAAASTSGVIRVWDANQPFKCLKRLITEDEGQVNKVAFSPDGSLLAAAGPYTITVWELEKRDVPIAVWNPNGRTNEWDPSVDGYFSLRWDPDGSRLSIALGNQIAIINVPR